MTARISYIALFLICCAYSGILSAQEKVNVIVTGLENEGRHIGSFGFNFSPGEIVTYNNGLYTIDMSNRGDNTVISLAFSGLNWVEGNKKNSLIIKRSWVKGIDSECFQLLPACAEINPGKSPLFDIKILDTCSGSGTLRIGYALKSKNKSCNDIKLRGTNHQYLNINFKIIGLGTKDQKAPDISPEDKLWNECQAAVLAKPIPCLKKYLTSFAEGKYVEDAKNQLNYFADKHYEKIVALKGQNDKTRIAEAAEEFINLFPKYVRHYDRINQILKETQKPEAVNAEPVVENGKTKDSLSTGITWTDPKPEEAPKPAPGNTGGDIKPPIKEAPKPKSEDEIAWEAALKADNCEIYEAYIAKYSKFRDKAFEKKAMICPMKINLDTIIGNFYRFFIENAYAPEVDSITPPIEPVLLDIKEIPGEFTHILEIEFPDDANYTLYIYDSAHPDTSMDRSKPIKIGNLLEPRFKESNDSLFFTFLKGSKPFRVFFRKKGEAVAFDTSTNERTLLLTKSFLKTKAGLAGTYDIAFSDEVLNSPKVKGSATIKPQIWNVYYSILLGALLLVMILIIRKNRKGRKAEKKKEELSAFMDSRRKSLEALHKKEIDTEAWEHQLVSKTNGTPDPLTPQLIMDEEADKPGGFKIKRLRKSSKKVIRYTQESELSTLIEEAIFVFDPRHHWKDSSVQSIHFTRKSVLSLDDFLVNQNLKPVQEKDGMIPEIGGILMGRAALSQKDGKYRLIVDEFVPINPESHSVFQIEFSTQSLVKDLGDIQDQFPEYSAIGWFHTHPGHGLFLSKPDLVIQERFFSEPYQFAMEIDSLTPKLDTAFFTFNSKGQINNAGQKKANTQWFSWLENIESLNQK